ncbi:MAG: hypothetical protein WCL44_02150 [bacterium]
MRSGHIWSLGALVFALVSLTAGETAAAGFDRSQYDVIVEAHPFGEVQPKLGVGIGPDGRPLAQDVQPAVPFSATLKLTMIREDDVSGEVCALDDTKNPAWHAYLVVGEEAADGIVVRKIDLEAKGVLLGKEGRADEWIFMNGPSTGATSAAAVGISRGASVAKRQGISAATHGRAGTRSFPSTASRPKIDPERLLPPGEMQQHLENYNMELIVAGGEKGPPLPIPLTPEQDDALVGAGILPPGE